MLAWIEARKEGGMGGKSPGSGGEAVFIYSPPFSLQHPLQGRESIPGIAIHGEMFGSQTVAYHKQDMG